MKNEFLTSTSSSWLHRRFAWHIFVSS